MAIYSLTLILIIPFIVFKEVIGYCDLSVVATGDISIDAKHFDPATFSVTLTLKGINTQRRKWYASEEAGFWMNENKRFQKVKFCTRLHHIRLYQWVNL